MGHGVTGYPARGGSTPRGSAGGGEGGGGEVYVCVRQSIVHLLSGAPFHGDKVIQAHTHPLSKIIQAHTHLSHTHPTPYSLEPYSSKPTPTHTYTHPCFYLPPATVTPAHTPTAHTHPRPRFTSPKLICPHIPLPMLIHTQNYPTHTHHHPCFYSSMPTLT